MTTNDELEVFESHQENDSLQGRYKSRYLRREEEI